MQSAPTASLPFLLKWIVAGVISLWISIPAAVQTLIVLMSIDYVTGVLLALMQRRLCSEEGKKGLGKKTLTLLLVVTVHYVVKPLNLGVDLGAMVATAFCVNELISITENCAAAGVPIPDALLTVLVRAKRITGRGKQADEVTRDLEAAAKANDAGSR